LSSAGPLGRWLPVVAWVAVIWTLSGSWFTGEATGSFLLPILAAFFPRATPGQLRAMHQGIRKLAHFTEYLILSLLLYRALRSERGWNLRAALLALVLAALYAMVDEVHQGFVPGRTPAATDCLIDISGAAAGQGLLAVLGRTGRLKPETV
jgi:VanZ family protein